MTGRSTKDAVKFYLHKIGGHLQELALAVVFVTLDHHLTTHEIADEDLFALLC